MSVEQHYQFCRRNIGAPVEITCHDGSRHHGIIDRVDETHVYLRPFDEGLGGNPTTFLWGWGAFGAGIAFGAIATIAFLPLFWW